jgi:hypothetical protein
MEDVGKAYKISVANLNESDHLEDLGIGEMIIKWILRKEDVKIWTRFTWYNICLRWQLLVNTVMNLRVP